MRHNSLKVDSSKQLLRPIKVINYNTSTPLLYIRSLSHSLLPLWGSSFVHPLARRYPFSLFQYTMSITVILMNVLPVVLAIVLLTRVYIYILVYIRALPVIYDCWSSPRGGRTKCRSLMLSDVSEFICARWRHQFVLFDSFFFSWSKCAAHSSPINQVALPHTLIFLLLKRAHIVPIAPT